MRIFAGIGRALASVFWSAMLYLKLRKLGGAIKLPFLANARYLVRSKNVHFGRGVRIGPRAHLSVLPGGSLSIGDGTLLGTDFVVSCAGKVVIGKEVLFAARCFVGDSLHEFEDVTRPVLAQGMRASEVSIGDGSWLGINVAVMPGVRIGSHCVIGANSVVTKDLPDNVVAAGVPAKVVKHYSEATGTWRAGDRDRPEELGAAARVRGSLRNA